ncbi:MAG: hypothetical protein NTU41_06880 [Chloroflexi bacterium]|nr:hypothetical protein [Chloroflexota bacterium]
MRERWREHGETPGEPSPSRAQGDWAVIRIMWILLLAGEVVIVIVGNIVGPKAATSTHGPTDAKYMVGSVLGVMSLAVLGLGYVIRRAAANPRSRIHRFLGSYLVSMLIAGSLCISVGVFGLPVFFVEGDYLWLYLFAGISAAALILLRPRRQDLINAACRGKRSDDSGPPRPPRRSSP